MDIVKLVSVSASRGINAHLKIDVLTSVLKILYMQSLSMQEMNLLVEVDQPGNQLDDYISRLNGILSQKAAGILQLQSRLVEFQKNLKNHQVLVFTSGH